MHTGADILKEKTNEDKQEASKTEYVFDPPPTSPLPIKNAKNKQREGSIRSTERRMSDTRRESVQQQLRN